MHKSQLEVNAISLYCASGLHAFVSLGILLEGTEAEIVTFQVTSMCHMQKSNGVLNVRSLS
jgi:hypothetical protein